MLDINNKWIFNWILFILVLSTLIMLNRPVKFIWMDRHDRNKMIYAKRMIFELGIEPEYQ